MNKFLLFTLSLFSLTACAAQQPATANGLTQATFAGQQVNLIDDQGRCTLTRPGNPPLTLDMKWPCRFSEDRQQKVRIENFHKTQIIMVERSEHLPAPSKDCATDLQPIRYFKGKLEAAPVSQIAACGPGSWDQKAYIWQFDW
ncbi:hypothetical protein ACCD10_12460 [Pseudomonas sp. Pseusp122]|uniref:hypothetical protein n=1 Tax=unclassified Pseudomonas TaxID=196821 RepID=UPI0039A60D8C